MPIFENLNLEFEQGWSCIVGSNGSGKSTLLKLISKEIPYEEGSIKGNDLTHYCVQTTEEIPENLENFMMTHTSKSFKIRDMLSINDEWLYQWDTLSFGERKRMQIALAIFEEPHDRELLDNLSQATIILRNKNTFSFKTPFSKAMNEYLSNMEFLDKTQNQQYSELKKLKKSIQTQHEKVSQSKKRIWI